MRLFEFISALLLAFIFIAGSANASYWFQAGARAGPASNANSGASVQIETVLPQKLGMGTMGFWMGENLPNGAFLQVGYVVENQSGMYPTDCDLNGCSGSEYLNASDAEWFYEYFLPGDNGTFLGSLGPDKSAGPNGQFNTYSFYAVGSTWYFLFNNRTLGSAFLGVSNSGPYSPLAMGELANSTGASVRMSKVIFTNLSEYKYGTYFPVSEAYGTLGYGVGSDTFISNPYGVEEIGERTNYFEVGSGLPQYTNNTKLWSLGYKLKIVSAYGNLSSGDSYSAYSSVKMAAPPAVYLSNVSRAVFQGWTGFGLGSYSGSHNSTTVVMDSNLTELAVWEKQNFINITSSFGNTTGTGWYANGSIATYGLSTGVIYRNGTPRFTFSGWNNGNGALRGNLNTDAPVTLTADWKYRTAIQGKDAYGSDINVSGFLIDNLRMNGTPLLDASYGHALQGVYYKGALLPLNYTIDRNSSDSLSFTLPIYNVSVITKDFFGLPVNVSGTVTYTNGTESPVYSGPKGVIEIHNVPYGYASFAFVQSGVKTVVQASGGIVETTYFISSINIGVGILSLALAIYLFVWRFKSNEELVRKEMR